ncbi:SWIM zinc finger family protein [Streptomyces sp. NPDC050560]|uniref:SWIM zinc finger family protein n=1 Tax=Streptomyces sp. NPDC050560 TaxID=3365630 RepID=UPI00379CB088
MSPAESPGAPGAPGARRPSDAARRALHEALAARRRAADEQQPEPAAPDAPEDAPRPARGRASEAARLALEEARSRRTPPRPAPAARPRTPAAHDTPAPDAPAAPPAPPAPVPAPEADDPHAPRAAPARAAEEPAAPVGAARTWWGGAWVRALETGALDPARLARGRAYAEGGRVGTVNVTPGRVLAYVQGGRPRPYRTELRVRTLSDAAWDRFLDAAADDPAQLAALLDRDMPHSLAEGRTPLLPGPGDLDPRCSCPDQGRPCKHAAALCYETAGLLDEDPFVLLAMRGRAERQVLDALARRSAAGAARAAAKPAAFPSLPADEALARRPAALPPPLPAPHAPGRPPGYPATPGGPDPFALDQLATDAAARAHALLTAGVDPLEGLTLWQDAVRIAAARPGSGLTAAGRGLYASLAAAAERDPVELARAVAAWRQGGAAGLDVLEEPWDPPAGRFDRARPALLAAGLPAFRPRHNHLTHPAGHLQLRLGRDHLWYAYESEPGHDEWWPRGAPATDPLDALASATAARPPRGDDGPGSA